MIRYIMLIHRDVTVYVFVCQDMGNYAITWAAYPCLVLLIDIIFNWGPINRYGVFVVFMSSLFVNRLTFISQVIKQVFFDSRPANPLQHQAHVTYTITFPYNICIHLENEWFISVNYYTTTPNFLQLCTAA